MEKWKSFSKEQILQFYQESTTRKMFLEKLGYKCYNKNAEKNILKEYPEINYEKFTSGKLQDLTGQTFGKLTVLHRDKEGYQQSNLTYWVCQCSCENKTILSVSRPHLISGHTKSCGCYKKEKSSETHSLDLKGKIFGKLTVKSKAPSKIAPNGRSHACWYCDCECGKKDVIVSVDSLRNGQESCGCSFSKGEDKIERWLINNNFNYHKQYQFSDLIGKKNPLRFDFAVFKENKIYCLIEYQGEQHYQVVDTFDGEKGFERCRLHDEKKRNYCENNGIYLLEIPYWDYTNINEILTFELKGQ